MRKKIAGLVGHPLFSGSAVMVFGGLAASGLNYLYHLVIGRMLGPVDYGVLVSVLSLLYIIIIVPSSASFAIVKFVSAAKNKSERSIIYSAIKSLLYRFAIIGTILVVLLSPIFGEFLHIENILSLMLVGPILFVSLMTLVNQATFQGTLKFVNFVLAIFISSLIKLIVGVLAVLIGFGVFGAVGAMVLGGLVAYWYTENVVGNIVKYQKKIDYDLKPFLKYAFPVLVQALAFTSLFTMDIILVKHFLPAFDAGLYAALSMLGKIIYFAAQPVTGVMFPIISKKRGLGEGYRWTFLASFFLTVGITVGVFAAYGLFPKIAIGMLYGEKYLMAAGELVWMGAFMVVYTACYIIVNFLLSIHKTRVVMLPLVAAVLQIVGIVYFHQGILQVIQVSLVVMVGLMASLCVYLGQYELKRIFAKA